MEVYNDPRRNRPADTGDRKDPHLRDEDGQQPGVPTMSSSDSERANEDLTETAGDNFRPGVHDRRADADLNDMDSTSEEEEGIY
jgi:hypothetical protein